MGANLITSLQESARFSGFSRETLSTLADFAISYHGNNQWMPKLLRALKTLGRDTMRQSAND